MRSLLPIAAVALLAGSAARAQTDDISNPALRGQLPQTHAAATGPSVVASAPEFHAAGAVAALTLLLGGVAVLKGWRRE